MEKMDIKDTVDDMIFKVCEYIKASDLSKKEDSEIKLECAMTFLVASIDLTDNPIQNIEYIMDQHVHSINLIAEETANTVIDYISGRIQGDKLL